MKRRGILRVILAALFVLVTGAFAIRTAVVGAYSNEKPSVAASFWGGHPDVLTATSMAEVGEAAARTELPSANTLERLKTLAKRSPLAPEPFLVRGATAMSAGDYGRAEQLFLAARQRDPRSVAARYLLADLFLRQNRGAEAIQELAVLIRLMPSFIAPLTPALAQYARTPGAVSHLRQAIRENPQLETLILTELASDPGNTELVLSLAPDQRTTDEAPPWRHKLVSTLIEAGEYDRAYVVWRRFGSGDESDEGFAFRRAPVPSPFSWTFAQQNAGTAEPINGRLDVVFSGTKSLILASKVARLEPGIYEMRMQVAGDTPESVRWSVTCLPGNRQVVEAPLSSARSGNLSSRFHIPPDCPAQKLELKGVAETFPATAKFSISGFEVKQVAAQ